MSQKYFIITYGCQMNHSDSERIAANLENFGYKPAKDAEAAGLIVVNACSVRQSAIHRAYSKINKYHKNKNVILAGCVLEEDKKKLRDKIDDFWHPDSYFLQSGKQGSAKRGSYFECAPTLSHPGCEKAAYVPIMTGCNNFCSYCVVPFTRGREKSRPADKIVEEVKSLIKKGYKEIMLLGQNVNSYSSNISSSPQTRGGALKGRRGVEKFKQHLPSIPSSPPKADPPLAETEEGRNIGFAQLLNTINSLPGDFTIKFMTSHPKDMSDDLINAIAKCEKVSKEIHLPIQSGDNTILKKMNRRYTVAHYKKLIKKTRAKIPNAVITTDIIVGFPDETKKQFGNTLKLCRELKFAKAYVSQYSPRPGTTAYKFKDNVSKEEKKRRWKILDKLVNKK